MGWSHEDSREVRLVLSLLESLQRESERVEFETGEVLHGVRFFRERAIPKYHRAVGKRFDFSVTVDNGKGEDKLAGRIRAFLGIAKVVSQCSGDLKGHVPRRSNGTRAAHPAEAALYRAKVVPDSGEDTAK